MKRSLRTRVRFSSHPLPLIVMLLALCAGLFPASSAQAANGSFAWAKSMAGTLADWSNEIKIDAAGNVYTTGLFQGTVDFDPGPGTHNLTSAGGPDIFVSKLDGNGNFVWARRMGGALSGADWDEGNSLALDASGNVYITGFFQGVADFDPGPAVYELTSFNESDVFVSKLDTNGNFVWARQMGGTASEFAYSVTVDTGGNIYTTGSFEGIADFDPGASTYHLTSTGIQEVFISKLDSSGNFVWARSMGGPDFERGEDVVVDSGGHVYTIGWFVGAADFDPGPETTTLTGAGFGDIFVSKLDSNGNFVWAKRMGGTSFDRGDSLTIDSGGHLYLTGSFSDTVDFDPGAGISNLVSAGNDDIFVSRLDNNGNFVWARRMGGVNLDDSFGLALDASGNVFTAGSFSDTVDFDPGPGTYNLTSAGNFDIFVSKLNSSGDFVWARGVGGPNFDASYGLALDTAGNPYTTGYFEGTADFAPSEGIYNLTSAGDGDIFVLKLQDPPVFADVPLGYWALDFVERLYAAGITGGCATSPLRYCPEETVTRAQMAVFLLRGRYGASYAPPAVGAGTGFGDVPPSYWAAAFIKQLSAEGITAGCGGGNFCPEQAVTRAQMAVFLLRAKYGTGYAPPAVGNSTGFGDVPPSYWAAAFIKQLVAEGITVGCGGGNYCPETPVTRAQMAVFLVRTFSLP
jgi:hypothetical protein